MPEYLAPGVYVEEVSFRSKSIEGVATSTTGFAGMTRTGPVQYPDGPTSTEPRLITSFTEFESVFGGLEDLEHLGVPRTTFTAHAARAFFENGGKRLYISRVYLAKVGDTENGVASRDVTVGPLGDAATATWRARWPGKLGNVLVRTLPIRSKNVAYKVTTPGGDKAQARRARHGAVVEVFAAGTTPLTGTDTPLDSTYLHEVHVDEDGFQTFHRYSDAAAVEPALDAVIQIVELQVQVTASPERTAVYNELGAHADQKRYAGKILDRDDPEDENAVVWLDWEPPGAQVSSAAKLMIALTTVPQASWRLQNGNDGAEAQPDDLAGQDADPDVPTIKATGLAALGEIDDIAIVALPDGGTYDDFDTCVQSADKLISHAERLRYRIAVIDAPKGSSMTEIREFRGRFDSKYSALYHPWIEIFDPNERASQGAPPRRLLLPPSGFVTGIYARNDIERGVYKAPANEVVRGLTKFEANINKPRQDVLNPEGVNCLRFFEGRGNRVWGARTMSSDPEWKYVNVRRLFIYLEHSIDKGTQWAVFEPNNQRLWANIRQTIEDFLLVQWKNGALMGNKPEEAFFVRCDRTTMTQNDLDNGRLICLIGVAPTLPAEFVIFRIGQFTANSKS